MLFCQLGHAKSLREICGGLAASEGKLRHLGLPTAPARSTLAYANEHRPWQLQQTIFEQLLAKCQILAASQPGTRKKKKFRFKNPLLSLDATVIDLCATMFDWAKFRLTKGAVKLHLLLDHDGYLPSFADHREGRQIAIVVQQQMQLHRSFGQAKLGPFKHRGAEIDHRGIQAQQGILETELLLFPRSWLAGRQDMPLFCQFLKDRVRRLPRL